MRTAKLALVDAVGDAIVARLVTDAITAQVVTNPTQSGSFPYVAVWPASENDLYSSKGHDNSNTTIIARAYSETMTQALQVADSILRAIGRDVRLTLASPFYHISTTLEAHDMLPDTRPEGSIYGALLVFRMQVGHINV